MIERLVEYQRPSVSRGTDIREGDLPCTGTAFGGISYPNNRDTLNAAGNRRLELREYELSELDLNVNAAREFQFGESVHRLLCRCVDFNQALVGA